MPTNSQKINAEIAKLEASAILEFYVLDATPVGGEVFRFFAYTDALGNNIVWQGSEYTAMPVEVTGFEMRSSGSPPRPSLRFANVGSAFSALVLNFQDLIGSRLIRKRTFAKFLDGMPQADPTAQFPDDIFFIERKVAETKLVIEFELGTSMDVDDVQLPFRQILANYCPWKYRGAECSYAGGDVVADELNIPIAASNNKVNGQVPQWDSATVYHVGNGAWVLSYGGIRQYFRCIADNGVGISGSDYMPPNDTYWKRDVCSKQVKGCKLRFGIRTQGLPFGGFPGTSRLPV